MKVKVCILKAVECEINDRFKALEVSENYSEDLAEECIEAVEEAVHIPWWNSLTRQEACQAEFTTGAIFAIDSVETGKTILEG